MSAFAQSLPQPLPSLIDGFRALVPRARGLDRLAVEILALCRREGLGEVEVEALVARQQRTDPERLQVAIPRLFAGERARDHGAIVALGELLEERCGEPLQAALVRTPLALLGSRLATVFGALLGISCTYLVLGGLIEGQSDGFTGLGPLAALLLFFGLLAFLGLFEALHISATQLHLMDLAGLRASHPRACCVHDRLLDQAGINRFLAGRQIVVVISVFLIAALSSFPEMENLPFTHLALPAAIEPAVVIGIPGALVVLWLAQLAPQFYATGRALPLMNTRAAIAAVEIAFTLQAIGIARPVQWISRAGQPREQIPLSRPRRWQEDAEELEGDGALSLMRRWECDDTAASLNATSTTSVHRGGVALLVDSSLLMPMAPQSLTLDAELFDSAGTVRALAPSGYQEAEWEGGERQLIKPLRPALGGFRAGEFARTRLNAEFGPELRRDAVLIERTPRYLLWTLALREEANYLGPVRVRRYRVGAGAIDYGTPEAEFSIDPIPKGGELAEVSYTASFPPPGTLFVFEWELNW
jgi:hypothetical protein